MLVFLVMVVSLEGESVTGFTAAPPPKARLPLVVGRGLPSMSVARITGLAGRSGVDLLRVRAREEELTGRVASDVDGHQKTGNSRQRDLLSIRTARR